jgi:hypothetical protein
MSGIFMPHNTPTVGVLNGFDFGVQLLTIDQPTSESNPHFLGNSVSTPDAASGTPTWQNGQFVGTGDSVAVIPSTGDACQGANSSVLLVDPTTGQTTILVTVPFILTQAVFDRTGTLVAFVRHLPPSRKSCQEATTTTTSTTTPKNVDSSSFSTGTSFDTAIGGSVLEHWSSGTFSKVATGVAAVTFVASQP